MRIRLQTVAAFLQLAFCAQCIAVVPDTPIGQYGHRSWQTRDGLFEGSPNIVAQTPDGYMWLGTSTGLFRFDGVRFTRWLPPAPFKLPSQEVDSLLGASDGALWIGTAAGLSRWKDGRLIQYPVPLSTIDQIREFANGNIWFTRAHLDDKLGALCTVKGLGVRCYGKPDGQPVPFAMDVDQDAKGNIWLGGMTELLRWRIGSSTEYRIPALKGMDEGVGIWAVAATPDNSVWVGIGRAGPGMGLQHFINGEMHPVVTPDFDSSTLEICSLKLDSGGVLWVGTEGHGLYRLNHGSIEHIDHADGLSGTDVCALFEDREGDMWAVGNGGIDKFSDLSVLSYGTRDGLAVEDVRSVLAPRDGSLWVGDGNRFEVLRDGKFTSVSTAQGLPIGLSSSSLEDRAGNVWLSAGEGLAVFAHGHLRTITEPDGSPVGPINDITEDAAGDVWFDTYGDPQQLKRVHDFVVHDEFKAPGLPDTMSIAADPLGGLWLGLFHGDLGHFKDGRVQTIRIPYPAADQQASKKVVQVRVDADGTVLGATPNGLIILRRGVAKVMDTASGLPCADIRSVLRDQAQNLWIYATCGYLRITHEELESWLADPTRKVAFLHIDASDGAISPDLANNTPPSAVGVDGRLWFATGSVLQEIDPSHQPGRTIATFVHVERLTADHKEYTPGTAVQLPPLTRDLEFDYTGLNFSNPEKVHFQYQLEGHDRLWVSAGGRRQAFYTDLAPGKYHFRVKATNNHGDWNDEAASLDFTIRPTFYQTGWFLALTAIVLMLALWVVYALRLGQLAKRVRLNTEAKANERERIARDLHDTVLQGVQGLIYKMSAIARRLPVDEPNRAAMEGALDRAEAMLVDGRNELTGLRRSWEPGRTLAEALTEAAQDLGEQSSSRYQLTEEGPQRTLKAEVCEEFYRIAVEALRNAFRYSEADLIEIELLYAAESFTLRVRDNGRGFAADLAATEPRPGHFGLQGLKERASRIGAELEIWSSQGAGTEVSCRIPAQDGYQVVGRRNAGQWLRRLARPGEDDH